MMGARYFAPFSSRIASPRILSLSLVPLSRLASRFPRVSREISHSTSRTITIYDYDSTIVITVCSRLSILLQAERRFFARRVLFILISIFGSQRDFQSGNSLFRGSQGATRKFYFNLEAKRFPCVEKKRLSLVRAFSSRKNKKEELFVKIRNKF